MRLSAVWCGRSSLSAVSASSASSALKEPVRLSVGAKSCPP